MAPAGALCVTYDTTTLGAGCSCLWTTKCTAGAGGGAGCYTTVTVCYGGGVTGFYTTVVVCYGGAGAFCTYVTVLPYLVGRVGWRGGIYLVVVVVVSVFFIGATFGARLYGGTYEYGSAFNATSGSSNGATFFYVYDGM